METKNRWFTCLFAASAPIIGVVAFTFYTSCASAKLETMSFWGESQTSISSGLMTWAFSSLIANVLLAIFIFSQLRVEECLSAARWRVSPQTMAEECLSSVRRRTRISGPVFFTVLQVALYICCVACIVAFLWSLGAEDRDFELTITKGFVSSLNMGALCDLSRIRAVANLRAYIAIVLVVSAWYSVGLAQLMDLMRTNTGLAYSLHDGKSDEKAPEQGARAPKEVEPPKPESSPILNDETGEEEYGVYQIEPPHIL